MVAAVTRRKGMRERERRKEGEGEREAGKEGRKEGRKVDPTSLEAFGSFGN